MFKFIYGSPETIITSLNFTFIKISSVFLYFLLANTDVISVIEGGFVSITISVLSLKDLVVIVKSFISLPTLSVIIPPFKFKSPEQSKLLVFSPEPTIYWKYNVSEPEPPLYVALPPVFNSIKGCPETLTVSLNVTCKVITLSCLKKPVSLAEISVIVGDVLSKVTPPPVLFIVHGLPTKSI